MDGELFVPSKDASKDRRHTIDEDLESKISNIGREETLRESIRI